MGHSATLHTLRKVSIKHPGTEGECISVVVVDLGYDLKSIACTRL